MRRCGSCLRELSALGEGERGVGVGVGAVGVVRRICSPATHSSLFLLAQRHDGLGLAALKLGKALQLADLALRHLLEAVRAARTSAVQAALPRTGT